MSEREPITIPPKRVFTHYRKAYITYRWKYSVYHNDYDKELWNCLETWDVFIGLKSKLHPWFGTEDLYYDGHTSRSIIIAGIIFGFNYGYDARKLGE